MIKEYAEYLKTTTVKLLPVYSVLFLLSAILGSTMSFFKAAIMYAIVSVLIDYRCANSIQVIMFGLFNGIIFSSICCVLSIILNVNSRLTIISSILKGTVLLCILNLCFNKTKAKYKEKAAVYTVFLIFLVCFAA